MTTPAILRKEKDLLHFAPIFKGDGVRSRGSLIEKKIDILESLAPNVNNRRSRRLLNDRLLIELVPRLNAQEIRGLFAPPPWGEEIPISPFSPETVGPWDELRNIDMDNEANIMKSVRNGNKKRKCHVDDEKMAVLSAWHRINCRTREALRRTYLSNLIKGYEKCIRTFFEKSNVSDILEIKVQNPFYRLLIHGICEFYNLDSVTETKSQGSEVSKIMKIKKKKKGCVEFPNLTLSHFLKMSKEGIW